MGKVHSVSEVQFVFSTISNHLALRRDALNGLAQLPNRFEDWFKYECVIGLHHAMMIEPRPWCQAVGVERDEVDLCVMRNPWGFNQPRSEYVWPQGDPSDIWLELKARTTLDKGPKDIVADIQKDIGKFRMKSRRGFVAVLILESPGFSRARQWADDVSAQLKESHSFRSIIYDNSLNALTHEKDVEYRVTQVPLAVLAAWDVVP